MLTLIDVCSYPCQCNCLHLFSQMSEMSELSHFKGWKKRKYMKKSVHVWDLVVLEWQKGQLVRDQRISLLQTRPTCGHEVQKHNKNIIKTKLTFKTYLFHPMPIIYNLCSLSFHTNMKTKKRWDYRAKWREELEKNYNKWGDFLPPELGGRTTSSISGLEDLPLGKPQALWERLVLMNQPKFSVTICSFSVPSVLRHFNA